MRNREVLERVTASPVTGVCRGVKVTGFRRNFKDAGCGLAKRVGCHDVPCVVAVRGLRYRQRGRLLRGVSQITYTGRPKRGVGLPSLVTRVPRSPCS